MKTNTMKTKKGFTLLELLIVIGILAILSTTVVLVINPAQLLKKARDSQRISDLNTMKTAIAYYITESSSPSIGVTTKTYSDGDGSVACTLGGSLADADDNQGEFTASTAGWIPIAFDIMAGGSPVASLPQDPALEVSTGNHYYVYGVASEADYTFKFFANMESTYYGGGGDGDVETTDGGTIDTLYEVGTDTTLTLATATDCFADTGI